MVSVWEEVLVVVVFKCFKKVGMYFVENFNVEEDDDLFEGEELMDIFELLSYIFLGLDMLVFDDEVEVFELLVDIIFLNWRDIV